MLMAILLGAIFGVIGGVMAYLIVYNEYRKHFTTPGRAVKEGLRACVIAFVVLVIGALITGGAVSFFAQK